MSTLTMRRVGIFRINVTGPNHCGIKTDLWMKYAVRIKCRTDLDQRGFLFDQLTVATFFDRLTETDLSCEQLAVDCAKKLLFAIAQEHPGCAVRQIRVMLSPEPFAASMAYSCKLKRKKRA